VDELVPWTLAGQSVPSYCVGCYNGEAPAGTQAATVQLPVAAFNAVMRHVSVHRETRSVRLVDLAEHFFAGRIDMARGYREASGQVPEPLVYAASMSPFYSLLDASGQGKQ
jgi:hypothetical protein